MWEGLARPRSIVAKGLRLDKVWHWCYNGSMVGRTCAGYRQSPVGGGATHPARRIAPHGAAQARSHEKSALLRSRAMRASASSCAMKSLRSSEAAYAFRPHSCAHAKSVPWASRAYARSACDRARMKSLRLRQVEAGVFACCSPPALTRRGMARTLHSVTRCVMARSLLALAIPVPCMVGMPLACVSKKRAIARNVPAIPVMQESCHAQVARDLHGCLSNRHPVLACLIIRHPWRSYCNAARTCNAASSPSVRLWQSETA